MGFNQILKTSVKRLLPRQALENPFLLDTYSNMRHIYRYTKDRIKPEKGARVYIKKGITRMGFFNILHERKVDYVLLRWWHSLPEMPEGEDMDILIKDEHRDFISDLLTFHNYGTDLKCDIYTIEGSRYGSHKALPYFQINLAHAILQTRVLYKGVYVPGRKTYFASLAYHALFHKGNGSGLPGFDRRPTNLEHDYSAVLAEEASLLNLKLDISAKGVYNWLQEQNFVPAEDTLSKLVEIRPELFFFQRSLYSDIRGGELLVYVIRERLVNDGQLENFQEFLKDEFQFEVIDVRVLNEKEKDICKSQIRGGKWDNGPYKFSGGPPVALVSVFDYNPWPLNDAELLNQPRMTNRNNLKAKYKFREHLNKVVVNKGHYNGVHSADNELDAWSYISLLEKDYFNKIFTEIERRRDAKYRNKVSSQKKNNV